MDIKGFAEILNNYSGPRSYYIFEAFVLELLKKHLEAQSKPFFPHYRSLKKIEYDGIAPDGIDDLPGPTLIEVKLYKVSDSAINHVMKAVMIDNSIKSVLLISGKKLTSKERSKILKSFPVSSMKIEIWDLSDLAKIAEPYPQSAFSFISELSQSILRDTVAHGSKRSPDEWKEKRTEHISKLKESCKNHGIVLFLGSGISKDAGIPAWNDLIYNLFVALIREKLGDEIKFNESEELFIIGKLKDYNDASPLLQARYIKTGLGEDSFGKVISKSLYKNYIRHNTNLLKAISKLCVAKRINSIVTYNFDNLLEETLYETGLPFKTIYRDMYSPLHNELAINHVHGFLPEHAENYEDLTESLLVFSEDGYHSLIQDPYIWSNIVQLNLLRENTCLLIGLSMTDPNLRRLLAISSKRVEEPKHYVILKKQHFKKSKDDKEDIRDGALQVFFNVNQELQEKTFQELGLNIIWIESYDEIPSILDSIRA